MNTENNETETPETPRQLNPAGSQIASSLQRFSNACLNKLSALKDRVSQELSAEFGTTVNARLIQQAVHEADALAATTFFPSLFLPALAEEKVRSAYAWSNRQKLIREQTLAFAA